MMDLIDASFVLGFSIGAVVAIIGTVAAFAFTHANDKIDALFGED